MKVFFDNNISRKIPRALQELFIDTHEIVHLTDKFERNVSDKTWIEELSKEGNWIVISADFRITKNYAEKMAFRASKLTGLFMTSRLSDKKPHIQAYRILSLWEKIEQLQKIVEPGSTYQISETKIRQL
mgnify:CR=1 FL=1